MPEEVLSAVTGRAMHLVFLIISYWLFLSFLQSFLFATQMFPSKRENMIHVLKYVKDAVFFPSELLPPAAESLVKEGLTVIP